MKTILLIGCKDEKTLFPVLEQQHFFYKSVETEETVLSLLSSGKFSSVLLDLDSVPASHSTIRNLASRHPGIPFLCLSRKRFHPELREAFRDLIYACLAKPVDLDEFRYWLKSLGDIPPDSRAPPR